MLTMPTNMRTWTGALRITLGLAALGALTGCEAASNAATGAGAFVEKTAQKIEQGTDDTALTLAVKGALFKADEKLERAVHVGAFKNSVSLSGVVPTAEDKARAEQIAMSVKGVERVVNGLDVGVAR
jgi:osmotically-inducible protein OsmY